MKQVVRVSTLAAGVALAIAGPAQALEPMSFGQGSLQFTPTVTVGAGYDSNYREDPADQSSSVFNISPKFALSSDHGAYSFTGVYQFSRDWYGDDSNENAMNHFLDLDAGLVFDDRNRLDLAAYFHSTEDPTSIGELDDEYKRSGLSGVYGFGVSGAPINVDLGYARDRVRSDNSANLNSERDRDSFTAALYYSLGPRTQALAEVRYRDTDYVSATELDSTTLSYFGGVRWEATAMTTGSARLGYSKQDFDQAGKPNQTANVWEIGVSYSPRTYSTINLTTSRALEDGDEGAGSIESSVYRVDWSHNWSQRISSSAGASYTKDEYDTGREDKTTRFNIGVTYNVYRWMDVGMRYTYTDSDSTLASETWDRNRLMLVLDMSL